MYVDANKLKRRNSFCEPPRWVLHVCKVPRYMDWHWLQFKHPQKCINDDTDVMLFKNSLAYSYLSKFIEALCLSVQGIAIESNALDSASEFVKLFLCVLDEVDSITDKVEPLGGSMRFGNEAFRTWMECWTQRIRILLHELLEHFLERRLNNSTGLSYEASKDTEIMKCGPPVPVERECLEDLIDELYEYAASAFGNPTRLDYGSGHELNFIVLLFCLFRIGYFSQKDLCHLVTLIFAKYINCVRRLQRRYSLEPAGSRGSWGLDDYHFLPFLFGAAQLIGQSHIPPDQITNPEILDRYAEMYFYLNSIQWILQTKVGAPFGECAPLLNDISAVPTWLKIYSGLFKMYLAEVLNKKPIVQHLSFGSLLPTLSLRRSDDDNLPRCNAI